MAEIHSAVNYLYEKGGDYVKGNRELAHPQFLRKDPFAQKTPGRGRGKLMGFRVEEFGSSS